MDAKARPFIAFDGQEYAEFAVMDGKYRPSIVWLVRHAVTEFLSRHASENLQRLTDAGPERRSA